MSTRVTRTQGIVIINILILDIQIIDKAVNSNSQLTQLSHVFGSDHLDGKHKVTVYSFLIFLQNFSTMQEQSIGKRLV